jgi:hypothetical protein
MSNQTAQGDFFDEALFMQDVHTPPWRIQMQD